MRKLQNGTEVDELQKAVVLTINTKCPAKWTLIDNETGEVYTPYLTPGQYQWQKLEKDHNET
jgi:hypothetical protein